MVRRDFRRPGQTGGMSAMKQKLRDDLTTAMKARDELTVSTLRMVLSAVTNAEVAGSEAVTLTDDQVMAVLRSEAKKRTEAAEAFATGGRPERAEKEQAEFTVIEKYLPAALDDSALESIVLEEIRATGATSAKDMGAVVKAVRTRVGATADGGKIAAIVKAALA
jgi:uncharacterized protein